MERPAADVTAEPAREVTARGQAETPLEGTTVKKTTVKGDVPAASVGCDRHKNVVGQGGRAWGGKLLVAAVSLTVLGCLSLAHVSRLSHLSPTPRSLLPSAPAASRAGDYLDPARQRRLDAPSSSGLSSSGVEGVHSEDEEEEMIM